MKSVFVIILNWNGYQDTVACLESLNQATYGNLRVVVLDNASTNDSVEQLILCASELLIPGHLWSLSKGDIHFDGNMSVKKCPVGGIKELHIIHSDQNVGFCVGNNVGMRHALSKGADYILILNNDTLCEPGFVEPLVDAAEANHDVGLIGGLICYENDPDVVWWAGGHFTKTLETSRYLDKKPRSLVTSNLPYETDWISGCMTFIPSRVIEKFGGYYEDFFIWSEEWDYSLRIKNNGLRLLVVPQSIIYHKVGKSLGVLKPLAYYYGTRNRLMLKRMYLKFPLRMTFLCWFFITRLLRFTVFAVQGRRDLIHAGTWAIYDYFLKRGGKWSCHEPSTY